MGSSKETSKDSDAKEAHLKEWKGKFVDDARGLPRI